MRYGLRDIPDRCRALYNEEKGVLCALAATAIVVGISTVAAVYGYQYRCAPDEATRIVVEPIRRLPSPTPVPFFLEGETTSGMSTMVENENNLAAKIQQLQTDALLSPLENQ